MEGHGDLERCVGHTAWCRHGQDGKICRGEVVSVHGDMLDVRFPDGGTEAVHQGCCHDTRYQLLQAEYAQFRAEVDARAAGIRDMAGLCRFLYGMSGTCEEKQAARERAKALFGIELDPEAATEEAYIRECLDGKHDMD